MTAIELILLAAFVVAAILFFYMVGECQRLEQMLFEQLQKQLECRADVLKLIEITERPYNYEDSQEYDGLIEKYCAEFFEDGNYEEDYDDDLY